MFSLFPPHSGAPGLTLPLAPLSVMRCHSVTWSPEEAPVANQTPRSLSEVLPSNWAPEAEGPTPLGPGFEQPTSQQGPTSEASIENPTADTVTGGAGWRGGGVVGAQNATRGADRSNGQEDPEVVSLSRADV
ncbi:unnamed protein product [Boreogadus saida]